MEQPKFPRVTLVGAGPGDPELITLKGALAIQSADALLYDALVDESLLRLAKPEAEQVFVGKRAGKHRLHQEEINQLIAHYAFSSGHVVRLKGGDPFVFGRGQEEVSYLQSIGIPVEVIPGISSAIAVPELQGVPVTRRGYSESFWVITGTTRSGALSGDIALAASSTATVIILMGMRKLRVITDLFVHQGRGSLPAMAIQQGSMPGERHVLATAATLADRVECAQLTTPGILVFGEAVALHPDWNYTHIAGAALQEQRA